MIQQKPNKGWRIWLRANRIVPLVTLLVAVSAAFLNVLNIIPMTPVEGIIIALLALLAVDALTERMSILEKIEARLGSSPGGEQLRGRAELRPPEELGDRLSEIDFVGVSGISLFVNHLDYFEKWLKAGSRLRLILLDPSSPALQTWNLMCKVTTTEKDIATSLELLKGLIHTDKARGKCEVRLSKVYVPFGMLMVDPRKETGRMNVEFYTYKTNFSDRPHLVLGHAGNLHWFEFYRTQFEQLWSDSKKWEPQA